MRVLFTALLAMGLTVAVGAQGAPDVLAPEDKALAEPSSEALVEEGDGSRARAVHLLPLYDHQNEQVIPMGGRDDPISFEITCGECHDYETVSGGWHFNAHHSDVDPGRVGEPWVLVDGPTGTQLPVSQRGWKGTWRPEDLGMRAWEFTKQFARHAPGGGIFQEAPEVFAPGERWPISGELEINCLACHNNAHDQNMSEWVIQIARENFMWAATAASGLGYVSGVASRLPDHYDYYHGPDPDNTWILPPAVRYTEGRFDYKQRTFLDLSTAPPADRCLFCHTVARPEARGLVHDWDVHTNAGMNCTDCHRNALSHDIVRGYEGEQHPEPGADSLTCRGCHLGAEDSAPPYSMGGRLGAPVPDHKSLPESHIETLTCTACHSGPWPGDKTETVRTARANRLGVHGKAKWDTELPYIASPVYMENEVGQIEPRRVLWPAFWGRLIGQEVTPLHPDEVRSVVDRIAVDKGDEPFTEMQVALILGALTELQVGDGEPVYIAGGELHKRIDGNKLASEKHLAAEPYSWPIGHSVRPAAQSLGFGGCTDCHEEGASFFHGQVAVASTALFAPIDGGERYTWQGLDADLLAAWNRSARFHTPYLVGGALAAAVLAFALLRYGFMGLEAVTRSLVAKSGRKSE